MSTFPIFKTFQRVGNFPITDTEVFDTIEDLQDYALNNPTAYAGQQCAVKGNSSNVYVINEDKSLHDISDYNQLKNKIVDYSEACYIRFDVDSELYITSINAKYLFWSSTNADYCIYNPLSDGWDGIPPIIEGRVSISLTDIPLDIFDVEGSVDDGYIKVTNKLYGKCKSPFNIETLVDVIYNVDYKDYPIVYFSNNGKINKSSVEGLESNLTAIEGNITSINDSLVPIFQPENTYGYITHIYNLNGLIAVWDNDWLVLNTESYTTYDIRNFKCRVEIDNRFVNISPVFSLMDNSTSSLNKIWIRDTDNVLSKNNNLGSIFIQFDLYTHSDNVGNVDDKYREYGTRKVFNELIPNMVIGGEDTIHENKCKNAIIAAVPEFTGNIYVAADIQEGENGRGVTFHDGRIADICIKYSADIIAFPQSIIDSLPTAPDILSYHVSPNIMTTLAHWHNLNIEHNHFETNTEFYDGVILCGAVVTDFVFSPGTAGYDFDPITHKGLFHYSYGHGLEFVVDFAILYPDTVYNNSYMQLEPITLIPSESYATSIIAAQLKLIKLATKSTWLEVRLAARATASNNGVWDKYKGFGHINVNAAIAYIEGNYNNQSIEIGKRYSQEKGYSDKLQYEHIYNNTPLPKRLTQEKITFNNTIEQQTLIDTDKVLIQDTIGSFKWISFANLKKQLGLQVGQKYLGGTIIKLNEDGTSGVIASYVEFNANYTDALTTYSINGLYSNNGYSNWRLPTISELNLLLTHAKSEVGLIGDVNDDGIVDNKDKILIYESTNIDVTNPEWSTKWFRGDINGDGFIDGSDIQMIDSLISEGGGSIFGKPKYLSINLSDVNPLTHCKGYSVPVLTVSNGVITVTPHSLIEIPIIDTVGVRLVRNF